MSQTNNNQLSDADKQKKEEKEREKKRRREKLKEWLEKIWGAELESAASVAHKIENKL